jgi:hypothetical protein
MSISKLLISGDKLQHVSLWALLWPKWLVCVKAVPILAVCPLASVFMPQRLLLDICLWNSLKSTIILSSAPTIPNLVQQRPPSKQPWVKEIQSTQRSWPTPFLVYKSYFVVHMQNFWTERKWHSNWQCFIRPIIQCAKQVLQIFS